MKAIWNGTIIAESNLTVVIERNHYFPAEDVKKDFLRKSSRKYNCPWKGDAAYFDVSVHGSTSRDAAWSYPEPKEAALSIKGDLAFGEGVEVVK